MENYNKTFKKQYAINILKDNRTNKSKEIIEKDEYTPIYTPIEIHPESEINNDEINFIFNDIEADLKSINGQLLETVNNFKKLMQSTKAKFDNINTVLNTEKERMKDLSILCNKYNNFTKVIQLTDTNVNGNYVYENNSFSLPSINYKKVKAQIIEINGNGYEGNKYVYTNNKFEIEDADTSNREYMLDNSNITYYEYSRIIANNSEKEIFPLVNLDSIHARCSIILKSNEEFNTLNILMDTNDVVLESLSTSLDGKNFTKSNIQDIQILNKEKRFDKNEYIYGSGILSFKDCNYVKIVLRASSFSNDNIAFIKNNDNNKEIKILDTGKRSVIKINNIELSKKEYLYNTEITFDNFTNNKINSIAIFANEYCADDLNIRDCITYKIKTNGLEYEIIPINSNDNGKKIIRTTSNTLPIDYTYYTNESIKNAKLIINLKTTKKYATPFISDLKILIGSE